MVWRWCQWSGEEMTTASTSGGRRDRGSRDAPSARRRRWPRGPVPCACPRCRSPRRPARRRAPCGAPSRAGCGRSSGRRSRRKPTLMRSFAPMTRPRAMTGAGRTAPAPAASVTEPAAATAPAPTCLMNSRRVLGSRLLMCCLRAAVADRRRRVAQASPSAPGQAPRRRSASRVGFPQRGASARRVAVVPRSSHSGWSHAAVPRSGLC
jgi:hypothetical protein